MDAAVKKECRHGLLRPIHLLQMTMPVSI